MRDESSRALEMSLSGGSVRRVSREVRLAMMDECDVPLRLMTIGVMSTAVPGLWLRMAFARGVYLARINKAGSERLWSVQYFHSLI
jgi:pyrroloquinoline quinone (PQQ) biosynthesis protein C